MIDYYYCYNKSLGEIGQKCEFQKSKSVIIGRIEANREIKKQFMYRENIYYNEDNIKKKSEHSVNIENVKLENKFFYHNEGGWTRDLDTSENQNKIKYIKRLEKDINLINSLKVLMNETTKIINKNNSINIYEEYFKSDSLENEEEDFNIKSILVLKDKMDTKYKRFVSNVKWSSDNSYKMAVAYSIPNYQTNVKNSAKSCLVYDLNKISNPYHILYCKSFIKCLRFNHKNSDLLLGGGYDGTINLWDLRKKNSFCESSLLKISHKNAVQDVCWLQSKTNSQCLTVSNDGLCLIWDIRNLNSVVESFILVKTLVSDPVVDGSDTTTRDTSLNRGSVNPLKSGGLPLTSPTSSTSNLQNSINIKENNMLPDMENSSCYFSGSCVEWSLEAGPSKILIGTEEGYILSLSKRPAKDLEIIQKYGIENEKHLSSISSINRIPTNLKYFISTDKWAFNIWSEDVKYPIISKYYNESIVTKGLWIKDSSFFMLGKKDGYIDFWNFLYNFNEPIIKHKLCNCSITEIENHPQNKYVALGTETGDIHILKLGESFCKINSEEKNALDELFERESKREKNLEYIRKQLSCAKKRTDFLTLSDVQIEADVIKKTEEEYRSFI